MKRVIVPFILLFLFISCADSGDGVAHVERDLLYIRVEEVKIQDVRQVISLSGHTKPYLAYNLVPRQGGIIKRILCDIGDKVKKGQLLAELDTDNLKIQKKKADAQLIMAQSNFDSAKANLERMTRLSEENAISQVQFDNAETMYNNAEANLQLAKAFVEEIDQAISDSMLYSPIDGYVAGKLFEVGDNINPMMGSIPIFVIHQLNKLKIQAYVAKDNLRSISRNQTAIVQNYGIEGYVSAVGVSADPASGSFPVEIVIENEDYNIKPGVFLSLDLIIEEKKNALAIPRSAIFEKDTVYVYKDGVVQKRKVNIDFEGNDYLSVKDGVRESEIVAVSNLYALRDNLKVRIE